MSMASRAILSNFFEEQSRQNHPQCLSGLLRVRFPTTVLKTAVYGGRQLLVWRRTVMHINKREDSGRHQRSLISSFYDFCPFSKKFASHNSMQKKADKAWPQNC